MGVQEKRYRRIWYGIVLVAVCVFLGYTAVHVLPRDQQREHMEEGLALHPQPSPVSGSPAKKPIDAPQSTSMNNRLTTDKEDAADPLLNIDNIIRDFEKGLDESEENRLAMFELEMRTNLKNGWRPPWSELDLRLTDKEIALLSTEELGRACFASGLPARSLLLYDNPNFGIRRLEILHKGYAELFHRPDCWKALVAAMDLYAAELAPQGESTNNVNAIAGLTTLPELYGYPSLRKSIVGHEREMISAHIRALEKLSAYLNSRPDRTKPNVAAPFFSATAPVALVQSGLALGRRVSPQQYEVSRAALSSLRPGKGYASRDIDRFVDQAAQELKHFVE